ncbi:MAG: LptF/LptG family permease, partial [Pseudomonadota bacterium]
MTVFDRYVARNVLFSTLVILLVLLALDALFTAIRELQRGDGLRAIALIAWRMPVSAYRYLPVAVLLGGVVGLGTLAIHNELVVARASGASIWRIFLSVLHAGIPLAIVLVLVGEFAVPGSAMQMQRIKHGNLDTAV